jgi:diacylglycerol O-acyltransferase / wax synthase
MRQLTSLDATFLSIESPTVVGHVCGLTVLDPSTTKSGSLTLEDTRALLEKRMHLLPPFRWRLVQVPFDLDNPYWVEDPDFDIEFHVRELALPAPGDDKQLAEQVARIASRPLDRARPLWEYYLIHGLKGGRAAQLTKMHHAAIDGVSGAEIMSVLLDRKPKGTRVPRPDRAWKPERVPSQIELFNRALLNAPGQSAKALGSIPRTLPGLADVPGVGNVPGVGTVSRAARRLTGGTPSDGDGGVIQPPRGRPPRTSFNRKITPHRRVAFGSLPLDEVKRVKNTFGVTVNDVVLALCTSALRRWLIEHDELPSKPLLAMVPVSVRTAEEARAFGNRVSVMMPRLPTGEPDPAERLRFLHNEMRAAKERHSAVPATLLQDLSRFVPPAVAARAGRVVERVLASEQGPPPVNVIISNVPGPQFPLYSAGARLIANYPVSAITHGVGLNMTVQSYDGHLDFGLVACRELVPDVANLIGYLRDALDELLAARPDASK